MIQPKTQSSFIAAVFCLDLFLGLVLVWKWYLIGLFFLALGGWLLAKALPVAAGWMTPPPRLQGIRFLFLIPGIAAGILGARSLVHDPPSWWMGLAFQTVSFLLVFSAFPARVSLPEWVAVRESIRRGRVISKTGCGPWLAALVVALSASVLLRVEAWCGAAVAFLAAGLAAWACRGFHETTREGRLQGEGVWLAALFCVAALMRFPFVGMNLTGFQLDEANHLLDAVGFNKGSLRTPFGVGWYWNPSFPYALIAEAFKIFSPALPVSRAFSAILSMATLFVFYRWARFHLRPEAALLATLLFSLSWWNLFYSLSPFTNIFTLLFEVLTFYFFTRALRLGQRADFWWAGVSAAAAVMSYISGKLVVLMAGTALSLMALSEGRAFLRCYGRHLLLSLCGFLWLLGPFLWHVIQHPDDFFGRVRELSIFNEVSRTGEWILPLKTAAGTVVSLLSGVGADNRFNIPGNPYLDPFTLVLLFLGAGMTLFRWRDRLSLVIFSGVLFGVLANALAIQGSDPPPTHTNGQRFFLILPFLFLGVGRGFQWVQEAQRGFPGRFRTALLFSAVFLVAGSVWFNGWVYYYGFSHTGECWTQMGFVHLRIVEEIENHGDVRWIVHGTAFDSVQKFMLAERKDIEAVDRLELPIQGDGSKDVMILVEPGEWKEDQRKLRVLYPSAVFTGIKSPHGEEYDLCIRIPKREICAAQVKGGRKALTAGTTLPVKRNDG